MKTPDYNSLVVADLVLVERDGGYSKGKAAHIKILRSALNLLIEDGYGSITMRRIAAACGMKLGNLTYYFRSREELIKQLLAAVLNSYEIVFDAIAHEPGVSPEDRLRAYCTLILEDIRTKKTTRLFPELWALSNHDPFIFQRVQDMYTRARLPIIKIIAEMRPDLSAKKLESLALFMSASMEGLTIFAGHEKPFEKHMPELEAFGIQSFINLVRLIE